MECAYTLQNVVRALASANKAGPRSCLESLKREWSQLSVELYRASAAEFGGGLGDRQPGRQAASARSGSAILDWYTVTVGLRLLSR